MQRIKNYKGVSQPRERSSSEIMVARETLRLQPILHDQGFTPVLFPTKKGNTSQPLRDKFVPLKEIKLLHVTDLRTVEKLWRTYSRLDNVWDLWEFRRVFIDVFKYPLLFVIAIWKSNIVGVLPLWFDSKQGHYEWISGWWSEQSRPFCNDSGIVLKMLKSLDQKVALECMTGETAVLFNGLVESDFDHFGLDLTRVGGTWDGYLESLRKKKRYNIKRDIKRVLGRKPVIRFDKKSDLEHLFRLNIARMSRKAAIYADEEKSVFEVDAKQNEAFLELWERRGEAYDARIVCVEIGGKVVSCDFNLIFQKKYFTLLGGLDIDRVSGIGSFANMLDIQDGVNHGCTYIDFCMEDHHWKHSWFKASPRYKVVYSR